MRNIDGRQFEFPKVEFLADTAHAPVKPNVLGSSGDVAEQLLELDLVKVYRLASKTDGASVRCLWTRRLRRGQAREGREYTYTSWGHR